MWYIHFCWDSALPVASRSALQVVAAFFMSLTIFVDMGCSSLYDMLILLSSMYPMTLFWYVTVLSAASKKVPRHLSIQFNMLNSVAIHAGTAGALP